MDIAVLLARLLLTGVFVVAGAAKLIDREGSRQALIGFGVPAVAARPLAMLLPLIELAVAVSLLPLAFAFWGAVGALGLLGLFAAGIALSMVRGEAPDCHCFGQLHSEPAGWSTLVRNAILAGVAGFIIVVGGRQPGASATGWLNDLTGAEQVGLVAIVVAAAVLAAQTWFLFQLMAQNGRLLERVDRLEAHVGSAIGGQPEPATANAQEHGLPVGSPAPAFSLPGLHGETMTLASLLAPGKPLLLLFTDPQCVPCNVLLPEISRWQREYADRMTAVVISRRDRDANLSKVNEHGLSTVLLQDDLEVYDAYQAQGTPSAVLVRPDGTIGSSPAGGARQIQRLLDTVLDSPLARAPSQGGASGASATNGSSRSDAGSAGQPRPPAPTPLTAMAVGGQPAPQIALPDLSGEMVELSDLGDRPTVLLFWNPNCGFCRRMVDDLNAWDADRPAGAPDLLIVSSGGADADQSIGTRIPFLLDEGFEAGRHFGANGTPSAVLINGQGRVASNVMVGAENVMGLLDPTRRAVPLNGNGSQPPLGPLVRIGSPAPAFQLPDLDGQPVTTGVLENNETLVLFWDPACGFCQRMLDDLKRWESERSGDAPELLVVSTGTVEVNRAMGLRSTVVLDQGFGLGRQFGASGTPSAVLVDRKGRVSSQVVAGAEAVLDLAGATAIPSGS